MEKKIRAKITGVSSYVPDYILTNDELSKMVDTSNEWILSHVGIKERHLLKEPGKATSDMGAEAVKKLLKKTGVKPEEIDLVICGTVTSDMLFPACACLICDKADIRNAFAFDANTGCCGFIYTLSIASRYIESGRYKKIIVVGADMNSSMTDYTDRSTSPLFGDAAGAVLIEPTTEDVGVMDEKMGTDGAGWTHLHMKAGGSLMRHTHETIDKHLGCVYMEGQSVFKWAVVKMADVAEEIIKRNGLDPLNVWLLPHQANLRIIDAVEHRISFNKEKVLVNIEKYGNTSGATIPLVISDFEHKFKKGDDLVLCSFGAGFSWGAIWLKWAY
ncbi:MAG: ketoacyl-ACP synthase III [Bacteroidales bacterium]|jgi:3-oxoacyl-[acyl-carrier-protein] synthase-3|nr:ketoacyl-ACP synthase III [Bacteroidales bacterium]